MKKKYLLLLLSGTIILGCNKKQNIEEKNSATQISGSDTVTKKTDFSKKEKELIALYKQALSLQNSNTSDTLVNSSIQNFSNTLIQLISNNEQTLLYPFDSLQKEHALWIATSSDNNLRIYSWDNNEGGTMRFFNQLFQFKSNEKTTIKISPASKDPQSFFSKVYTLQNKNRETVYIAISNSILSSNLNAQRITAYQIKNTQLQELNLFKTTTRLLSSINVEFDFFSVVDRPERPVELIVLEGNILKIPLVDKDLKVASKNLIYEWDGSLFNYKGIK